MKKRPRAGYSLYQLDLHLFVYSHSPILLVIFILKVIIIVMAVTLDNQYLYQKMPYCLSLCIYYQQLRREDIIMNRQIQECINFAKIAEQTERYDDMVRFVREMLEIIKKQGRMIQDDQIKLFSNALKCKINSRRTAWRALEILYSKEVNTKNRSSAIIHIYKDDIQKEIRQICHEAISKVDSILKNDKLKLTIKLQLYKMRGDFHRYLCEISKEPEELKKIQKECESSYKKGIEELKAEQKKEKEREKEKDYKEKRESNDVVASYDARRLSIYLNLSVFYYEIMTALPKAIELCQQGFNLALENISDLQQARYIDSVTIMQLMHDNITAWKSQKQKKK